MKDKRFTLYYALSLIGVLLASLWPLIRGGQIIRDMIVDGTVMVAKYPKYIIPYLPIALAVILGVALMPLILRSCKRWALAAASALGLGTFLASELLLEKCVIVTGKTISKLESWQMYMCYVQPEWFETRTWTPVDVLIGDYHPAFKLHFYAISVVLILALLNVFYGFAAVAREGKRDRVRHLILQAVSAAVFLGLCILACFTAFWRTGELTVSPLSAFLMGLFFTLFGVTVGLFVGSHLIGHRPWLSLGIPALSAGATALLMYVGELILLHGHLYRFGKGFFFEGLGALVLAPIDILVILFSTALTALILWLIAKKQ